MHTTQALQKTTRVSTATTALPVLFWPVARTLAASLLVAACAHLTLPLLITPVPFTLQPLAVLLVGLLLPRREAFAALSLYLLEGAAGLPVFTPTGLGGLAQLFGPTGGYLIAYPAIAALASSLYRLGNRSFGRGVLAAGIANLVLLGAGASWFAMLTHASLGTVTSATILPFLPGDAVKVFAAAGIASSWTSLRGRFHKQ
jgi:biotin transport system substrate-specific component